MQFRVVEWKPVYTVTGHSNSWKRSIAPKDDPASDESVILTEFLDLVELNVIVKRDVYTVAQLRKCLDDLNGSSSRSTDIKNILTTTFRNEIKRDLAKSAQNMFILQELISFLG